MLWPANNITQKFESFNCICSQLRSHLQHGALLKAFGDHELLRAGAISH